MFLVGTIQRRQIAGATTMRSIITAIGLAAVALLSACGDGKVRKEVVQSDGSVIVYIVAEDGSMTIENTLKDGEKLGRSVDLDGGEWPASAPQFAERYPGAAVTYAGSDTRNGATGTGVKFTTSDSPRAVIEYYELRTRNAAMGEMSKSGDDSDMKGIVSTPTAQLFIFARTVDGKTEAELTYAVTDG